MKIDNESQLRVELTKIVNSTSIEISKQRVHEILQEVFDLPANEYLECREPAFDRNDLD